MSDLPIVLMVFARPDLLRLCMEYPFKNKTSSFILWETDQETKMKKKLCQSPEK